MNTPNKRQLIRNLLDGRSTDYVPAAFFLHFDPQYHRGQAAVDKHLEFFRDTDMDFVKIQYEHRVPGQPRIERPADWAKVEPCDEAFFAEPLKVVEGIVQATKSEAMVVMTLYSPFMWAGHMAGDERLNQHIQEDLPMVQRGMEAITESVRTFVRGCIRLGVDGFYASTQGGESHRFADTSLFDAVVRPYDLSIMHEIDRDCAFNILHICDYAGSYDSLERFLDYPGHVVNSPMVVGGKQLSPREVAGMFNRPFMGGLDRHGPLSKGGPDEIRVAAEAVLADAPSGFILAADCTVPSSTPWENLRLAISTAHSHRGR